MFYLSFALVLGCICCSLLGGWYYFRRYTISRPPIGIFTLTDLTLIIVMTIVSPLLYLVLPLWVAASVFVLSMLSILYVTWEPVVQARWATWLVVLTLLAFDVCAMFLLGPHTDVFYAINNGVLLMVIIGIANLWAQSGIKARHVVLLSAFLAIYDLVTTTYLPITRNLFIRLSAIPFAPMLSWAIGKSTLEIGLGDMLLAVVFPLVMYKAFSFRAGITAMMLDFLAIGSMVVLPFTMFFPMMVVLGPLMVLQYLFWSKKEGLERTTWQYLQEEAEKHWIQKFW